MSAPRQWVYLVAGLAAGMAAGAYLTHRLNARTEAPEATTPDPTPTPAAPDQAPAPDTAPVTVAASMVPNGAGTVPGPARPARRDRAGTGRALVRLLFLILDVLAALLRPAVVRATLPPPLIVAPWTLPAALPRPPVCRRIVAMRRALPVRGPDAPASGWPFRWAVGVT